jgi:glucosamine 6-phosphate synthetase-like amidotransferase/phosphosugar isomerase protein
MCGIFAAVANCNIVPVLIGALNKLDYHLSLVNGADVDESHNLAKLVIVE